MTFPVFPGSNPSGYNLTRSLRFRSSATAYLSKTVSGVGNQQKYTYSGWIKRGLLSGQDFTLFGSWTDVNNYTVIYFANAASTMRIVTLSGGTAIVNLQSAAVFRDPSAWYHFVVSVDTTQATAANRVRFYVNNVQNTSFVTNTTQPSQNANILMGVIRGVGYDIGGDYFDGYLAEVNFIDGQALTPSSFGSTNTLTGVWQPARYTGTYGTNGFYLPFTDNSALTTSSNVGLGKDFSGNGNYWTTNNISITAGVTYDSMTDVPTLTSATAANFAVLNPINKGTNQTIAGGNLTNTASGHGTVLTTIGVTSGLWYGESTLTASGAGGIGFTINQAAENSYGEIAGKWWCYDNGGNFVIINQTSAASYSTRFSAGQVWQWAIDAANGKLWIGVNNAWLNSTNGTTGNPATGANPTFTFTAGTLIWPILENAGVTWNANFGQRPFSYTPPTGYVALNTYNLPTSTIVKGNTVMDATLWTGNNTSRSIANAAPFKPDLVWIKSRSNAEWNILFDSVRGTGKSIYSNASNAEVTNAGSGYVSAFNSDGFSVVGGSTDSANVNATGYTYVGWQWQAGQGSSSSNTSGSITSTVSVNASAGFSVVTYTGTGANATVGHGLGVAPQLVILKDRATANRWLVYHTSLGATQGIYLEDTLAAGTSSTFWNNTAPTSSTVSVGTWSYSGNQVMYCWTPIAGFSAFGSYTGNGSADGPFVYTGFRPKYVLIKRTDTAGNYWRVWDSTRATYNAGLPVLYPNVSDAEDSVTDVYDLLSNGFKLRTSAAGTNASSSTYIYAAYAENPFKNSLAR